MPALNISFGKTNLNRRCCCRLTGSSGEIETTVYWKEIPNWSVDGKDSCCEEKEDGVAGTAVVGMKAEYLPFSFPFLWCFPVDR